MQSRKKRMKQLLLDKGVTRRKRKVWLSVFARWYNIELVMSIFNV